MMKAPAMGVLCLLFLLGACPKAPGEDALDARATDGILGAEGSSEGVLAEEGMGRDLLAGADAMDDDARRGDTSSVDGERPGGGFAEVKTWTTSNHLKLYVFRPGSPAKDPSLVVALHGCGQSAEAYEAAGWSALADQRGFYVVYPQTSDQSGCFPWFDLNENRRGLGVAQEIASMTRWAMKTFAVKASKVYITGLSAGGAMTAVMLASYPELYRAGAIIAGIPYGCASGMFSALFCMNPGVNISQGDWVKKLDSAFPGYTGAYPRVSIWQGTWDYTVRETNGDQLAKQWTGAQGIAFTKSSTTTVAPGVTRRVWPATGDAVELWKIAGMGHAVPVMNGCGTPGPYFSAEKVCATEKIARFFGLL